jgi:RNA polymerase sigma-70 factor, ECF subfamily
MEFPLRWRSFHPIGEPLPPLRFRCRAVTGEAADLWHRHDEAHFDQTVRPHIGPALRVAARLVGSEDLAWDATQEALLSLWNTADRPANLSAWLARAVRHRCLHLLRGRSRSHRRERRAASHRHEVSCRDEPCRLCQQREWLRQFGEALAQLPQEQRGVFELCELEDRDYEAAAGLLGIPVGTVRSRLHRARLALRQTVGGDEGAAGQSFFSSAGTKRAAAALSG